MANKKKQFDQEFKQNAVNYCLTHPELSRKECAKNLGIGDRLYIDGSKKLKPITTRQHLKVQEI